MALEKQVVNIPLAAGLQTKADPRALQPPGLLSCKNAQFTETGGIQKRFPYTAYGTNIAGGGSLADLRRVVAYDGGLLAFSKENLYTWSARDVAWINRGTYLAPKTSQNNVFVDTTDQPFCDRAELAGTIVYAYASNNTDFGVKVGAVDKTTGSVICAATSAGAGSNLQNPRLVVLTNYILLFVSDKGNDDLLVKRIDPANVATSLAASWTTVASTEFDTYYDVARLTATSAIVVWRRTTTTSYGYATVDETPTVTASTKARACTGPIAVSVAPSGLVAVLRESAAGTITGDILTAALVDSSTSVAVGTVTTGALRISAGFRSVQNSSQYRCYALWDNGASQPSCECKSNWLDTGGTAGTQAAFVYNVQPATKGFDHNGSVFFWVAGAPSSTIQSSYYLYRDDATLIAKAVSSTANAPQAGRCVAVQNTATNVYSWCGATNQRVVTSGASGYYGDASPVDVTVEFDSNEARRTAQIGRTLYISGGQVLQYDGQYLTELGFHNYPERLSITDVAAGALAEATYNWLSTYASQNAKGELDRSTTTAISSVAIAASRKASTGVEPLTVTLRRGSVPPPAVELWRTVGGAALDSAFYLVTDKDPSTEGNTDNPYIANLPGTLGYQSTSKRDNMLDSALITKEAYPEVGTVLERIAPWPATILAANHERLFLAGLPGDPYAVWPSLLRGEDEVPGFNEAFIIRLPAQGGKITALAFYNNTLVVFKESSIYFLPGEGLLNDSAEPGQQNFGPPQLVSSDVGARSSEVVSVTPEGIFFLSQKGWYSLPQVTSPPVYIGGPVADFDTDTFSAVHCLESQHQVRCFSTSRVLTYDYLVREWSEWEIVGSHACIYNGAYHYCSSTSVYQEATSYATANYSLIVETAWIKFAGLIGYQRVRKLALLGEYRSAHDLKLELFKNYQASAFQTKTWTVSPTTTGGPELVRHGPSDQKCTALKIRITDLAVGLSTPPTGEALKLTGLALEVGVKRGLGSYPAAQKS